MKERKTKIGKWLVTVVAVILLCGLTVGVSSLAGGLKMAANGVVDEKEYEGEIETWALELQKIEPDSKAAQSEDVIEDEAVPLKDVSGKR